MFQVVNPSISIHLSYPLIQMNQSHFKSYKHQYSSKMIPTLSLFTLSFSFFFSSIMPDTIACWLSHVTDPLPFYPTLTLCITFSIHFCVCMCVCVCAWIVTMYGSRNALSPRESFFPIHHPFSFSCQEPAEGGYWWSRWSDIISEIQYYKVYHELRKMIACEFFFFFGTKGRHTRKPYGINI